MRKWSKREEKITLSGSFLARSGVGGWWNGLGAGMLEVNGELTDAGREVLRSLLSISKSTEESSLVSHK